MVKFTFKDHKKVPESTRTLRPRKVRIPSPVDIISTPKKEKSFKRKVKSFLPRCVEKTSETKYCLECQFECENSRDEFCSDCMEIIQASFDDAVKHKTKDPIMESVFKDFTDVMSHICIEKAPCINGYVDEIIQASELFELQPLYQKKVVNRSSMKENIDTISKNVCLNVENNKPKVKLILKPIVSNGSNIQQINSGSNIQQINCGSNIQQINSGSNIQQINSGSNIQQINNVRPKIKVILQPSNSGILKIQSVVKIPPEQAKNMEVTGSQNIPRFDILRPKMKITLQPRHNAQRLDDGLIVRKIQSVIFPSVNNKEIAGNPMVDQGLYGNMPVIRPTLHPSIRLVRIN